MQGRNDRTRRAAALLVWTLLAAWLPGAGMAAGQEAPPIVLLSGDARAGQLAEALQVELLGQGRRVGTAGAPQGRHADAQRAAARRLAADLDAEIVLWMDDGGDPLRPPTIHALDVRADSARSARLPAALDVVDPRVFALVAASLLEDVPPPADAHPPPAEPNADAPSDSSSADGPQTTVGGDARETAAVEAAGETATPAADDGAPAASSPPTARWRGHFGAGLSLIRGSHAAGVDASFDFGVGLHVLPSLRLDASAGMLSLSEGRLLGAVRLGPTGLLSVGALQLGLGAHASVAFGEQRSAFGGGGSAEAGFVFHMHRSVSPVVAGLRISADVWPALDPDRTAMGISTGIFLEMEL